MEVLIAMTDAVRKTSARKIRERYNARAIRAAGIRALDDHATHTVTPSLHSLQLLRKAYADVYQKAFPIREEQESLEGMIARLKKGKIIISLIGSGLKGVKPVLKGMAVGYHYPDQDVGLLGYLATAPQFQGQGLGRHMDNMNRQALLKASQARGKKLAGLFLECNPPGTPNDVMDPVKRIAMYEKWGAITLPVFYKQPPLEKGAGAIELKLLAEPHPLTGAYPSKETIKGYLKGLYEELQEFMGCAPEKNPDYLRSVAELDRLDLEKFYKETLERRVKASRRPSVRNKPPQP